MKNKHYILYLFILLSYFGVFGQNSDVSQLLLKSQQYYESQASINLLIDYKLYDAPVNGKLIDEIKGQYIRLHSGCYSKYGYMHTFSTARWYWVIDDQSKVIYVKDITKEQNSQATNFSPSLNPDNVGEYLKLYNTVKVNSLSNNEYKILISNPTKNHSPFKSIVIWLNNLGEINKLELIYQTTLREMGIEDNDNLPRMVISYQTSTAAAPSDILESNKYFTISNSQLKGIGKYQKHTIKNF